MWFVYILISAIFSAASTIFIKLGVRHTDSTLATGIKTVVVTVLSWAVVFATGLQGELGSISGRTMLFLVLSGLTTGGSWLCNYGALKLGEVDTMVAVMRCGMVLAVIFSFIFLRDPFKLPVNADQWHRPTLVMPAGLCCAVHSLLFLFLAVLLIILFRLPALLSVLMPVPASHAASDSTIYILIYILRYSASVSDKIITYESRRSFSQDHRPLRKAWDRRQYIVHCHRRILQAGRKFGYGKYIRCLIYPVCRNDDHRTKTGLDRTVPESGDIGIKNVTLMDLPPFLYHGIPPTLH